MTILTAPSLFTATDNIDGLVLEATLDIPFDLPFSTALFACPAIELYQEAAGNMYMLEQSCMMIGEVF